MFNNNIVTVFVQKAICMVSNLHESSISLKKLMHVKFQYIIKAKLLQHKLTFPA